MEIIGKLRFKVEFEKVIAVGLGIETNGIIILLPFIVIMIGFTKFNSGI